MTSQQFKAELAKHGSDSDAIFLQRFFKTGTGQYGEGDIFIGVRVPMTRLVCKDFQGLPLSEIQTLFDSPVHEHRLAAVILCANQYKAAKQNSGARQKIFDMYLKNLRMGRINNWDLVDVSCEYVIGEHERQGDRSLLFELARSDMLWQRRVSIISTFAYIKTGDPAATLELAELLWPDTHDLMQKATGWMLREVGKRIDEALLLGFLDKHAHELPRTCLRYAIEKLPPQQRTYYMGKKNEITSVT
ncbi:MAG: DNA alkylation repair protein [Candidatus Saccharimonadales bacterium]